MPVTSTYKPDPMFQRLGPEFADPVTAARFPQHILRKRNQIWSERVGLGALTDAEWEAHFARFQPLPGNMPAPLAMRATKAEANCCERADRRSRATSVSIVSVASRGMRGYRARRSSSLSSSDPLSGL